MTISTSIGQRIRHYRLLSGVTQRAFAKRMGVTNVHLCNVERGVNGLSIECFEKACRVLKRKPSEILAEIGR